MLDIKKFKDDLIKVCKDHNLNLKTLEASLDQPAEWIGGTRTIKHFRQGTTFSASFTYDDYFVL